MINSVSLNIFGFVIIIFNACYGQGRPNLPESIFMNISFVVAQPDGEFSNNVASNGLGIDFDGGWYVNNGPIALGLNIIGIQYGNFNRKIPYSYYSSLVTLTERTESTIFIVNPYIQPTLRLGDYTFYTKLFSGYQMLSTDTKITNDDQQNSNDGDRPDYIAKTNVSSDGVFNYGIGLGLTFPIYRGGENGPIFLSCEVKWSNGGEAEYLNAGKDGAIILSDPSEGPVVTTINPDRSKTNLVNISLGIGF